VIEGGFRAFRAAFLDKFRSGETLIRSGAGSAPTSNKET